MKNASRKFRLNNYAAIGLAVPTLAIYLGIVWIASLSGNQRRPGSTPVANMTLRDSTPPSTSAFTVVKKNVSLEPAGKKCNDLIVFGSCRQYLEHESIFPIFNYRFYLEKDDKPLTVVGKNVFPKSADLCLTDEEYSTARNNGHIYVDRNLNPIRGEFFEESMENTLHIDPNIECNRLNSDDRNLLICSWCGSRLSSIGGLLPSCILFDDSNKCLKCGADLRRNANPFRQTIYFDCSTYFDFSTIRLRRFYLVNLQISTSHRVFREAAFYGIRKTLSSKGVRNANASAFDDVCAVPETYLALNIRDVGWVGREVSRLDVDPDGYINFKIKCNDLNEVIKVQSALENGDYEIKYWNGAK